MNDRTVEKLEPVAIREIWKHEAYDFTSGLMVGAFNPSGIGGSIPH